MKRVKYIFRWLVGIVVGLYLAGLLLLNLPVVQRWMASGVASLLEETLGTKVEIGRVQMGWNGRVVVNDLCVWDYQQEEMINVARVGARISVRDAVHKRIRIGNAQLFGLHANLYQECEGCDPNFKFLIDAFASKDTTRHTPLDLSISQLLVRRGNVKWEQRWKAQPSDTASMNHSGRTFTKFDAAHIELSDLNVTAHLNCLTDDSLNLRVKRFDAKEKSGLTVKALAFNLVGNKQGSTLTDFKLEMPESSMEVPSMAIKREDAGSKNLAYEGMLKAHLSPTDFIPLLPRLTEVKNAADVDLSIQGEGDKLNVSSLRLQDNRGQLRLSASARAEHLLKGKDSIGASLHIQDLYAHAEALRPYLNGKDKLNAMLQRIGHINATGDAAYNQGNVQGDISASTPLGTAAVTGKGNTNGTIDATLSSSGFQLGELLDRKDLGLLALDMNVKGTIDKQPNLTATGRIPEMEYKGYRYRNVDVNQCAFHNSQLAVNLGTSDPNAAFEAEGEVDFQSHSYKVNADIAHLVPHTLNLTKRYADTGFSGQLYADLKGTRLNEMEGVLQLNGFTMTDSIGTYRPGDIHLTARTTDEGQHLLLISPFLEAQMEGNFEPKVVVSQIRHMVSNYLPTEQASRMETNNEKSTEEDDGKGNATPLAGRDLGKATKDEPGSAVSFTLRAYNAEPLRRLLGVPVVLNGTVTANGEINSDNNALWLKLKAPYVQYNNEHLRNIDLHLESNYESMLANLGLQRQMKGKWINLGLDTEGFDGKLTTRLSFDNRTDGEVTPERNYSGDVNIVSRLWQDSSGKQGFMGQVLQSSFNISDTIWTMHPGFVTYYDGKLTVDSFQVSQGDRFIRIDGRASKSEADTLHAKLQRINLEYIFSLINFHAVELTGEATGDAYGRALFSSPKADAYVHIPAFALNYGTMGDLDIHLNWGQRLYSIFMDGRIIETKSSTQESGLRSDYPYSTTLVKGYITPKKDIDYHGIDLDVKAERVNLEFINKWTASIFDNLQGRATGWAHIFGPFKQINIEGDAVVNEANVGIPFIGVRYHIENDTVALRPDNIYFQNAHLYDPQGNPGIQGHQALVSGHLHHDSFKNLTYDVNIQGQNILGYNFTDFGDQNFYGTVHATGDVTLNGRPGYVRIGIKAHPEQGTSFTYNASTPDKLTDTPFISYVERNENNSERREVRSERRNVISDENPQSSILNPQSSIHQSSILNPQSTNPQSSNDLYIDFDLDIDNQSTMNLLMDARSGDKISLNGSGRMLAHYHNKGAFQLYGTYRVSRGNYNLSLQEVIHKDFVFSPDGTLTFKGEPYDADLNLQAVHTVNGVSLNDINPKANFSNTTTRVNCLMNIGGKAREPRITFDFDIPNANEEEKQMVRSLISTEEERNMQVIYLLGIGRFYAYDYANETQTQGTTAMNSLLSSTLSGTINQALSNMLGKTNWNFGANLRTGEMGWSDMDVEGMLQGNLLNNRLLINGNFGYRDNPVANSNFIGDFDVKYLLTRTGSVALKAYSETNDRYFTKSSLTTQGIGVLLKKDFTTWKDLVGRRKRKVKGEK